MQKMVKCATQLCINRHRKDEIFEENVDDLYIFTCRFIKEF